MGEVCSSGRLFSVDILSYTVALVGASFFFTVILLSTSVRTNFMPGFQSLGVPLAADDGNGGDGGGCDGGDRGQPALLVPEGAGGSGQVSLPACVCQCKAFLPDHPPR